MIVLSQFIEKNLVKFDFMQVIAVLPRKKCLTKTFKQSNLSRAPKQLNSAHIFLKELSKCVTDYNMRWIVIIVWERKKEKLITNSNYLLWQKKKKPDSSSLAWRPVCSVWLQYAEWIILFLFKFLSVILQLNIFRRAMLTANKIHVIEKSDGDTPSLLWIEREIYW